MIDSLPSLTAAVVGLFSSLKWHMEENENERLYAEVMRNIHWRQMPLPLWWFLQFALSHPICSRATLLLLSQIPGVPEAIAGVSQRKMYMERQVRHFLEEHKGKYKQVLIVAAGYDTLALRLSQEFPDVPFVELDHPATGNSKRRAFESLYKKRSKRQSVKTSSLTIPSNLYYCHEAVGVNTNMSDALKNCSPFAKRLLAPANRFQFQRQVPTAVVAEGLTFYLTEAENRQLFTELGEVVGCPGSIVAFDFFHLDEYGRPVSPNVRSSLLASIMKYKVKLFGEPFKWGVEPEQLQNFLEGTPWRLFPTWESADGTKHLTVNMGIEYEATARWERVT